MNIIRFTPTITDADDIVHKFGRRSLGKPVAAEMLYLPSILFRYRIDWLTFFGKKRSERGLFMADLIQGNPTNIRKSTGFMIAPELRKEFLGFPEMAAPAFSKRTIPVDSVQISEDSVLPQVLGDQTAVERAKSFLRYDLMRVIGGLRFRTIEIGCLPGAKILYYPLWLVYYRGKKGEMRFQAFDGLTGEKEKSEIVRSIKLGLLKKKELGTDPTESAKK
jgi:hypothetical protein